MARLSLAALRETCCGRCGFYSLWWEEGEVICHLCGAVDPRFTVTPVPALPLVHGREMA